MRQLYVRPEAILRAAQRKLGGRIVTYDNTPALAITRLDPHDGHAFTVYLSVYEAADEAHLHYRETF